MSAELEAADAQQNVSRYNAIVGRINKINASLNKETTALKKMLESQDAYDRAVGRRSRRYRTVFLRLKTLIAEKQERTMVPDAREELYLASMAEKIHDMDAQFSRVTAPYTASGNHVVVEAVLNGKATASLMVDTGASIILISRDIADELGMDISSSKNAVEIVVADGRSVDAVPVILDTVTVGDAKVRHVQAAVLREGGIEGFDGLLGMSFLSHFTMSIDSKTNTLLLEQVIR